MSIIKDSQQQLLQQQKDELPNCKQHEILCKYICTELSCQQNTKIACSECMLDGVHSTHDFKNFVDIMKKVNIQYEKYSTQESIEIEKNIKLEFQKLKDKMIRAIDDQQNFFLKQIYQIDKNILIRLSAQRLNKQLTKEDIYLIQKLDEECQKPKLPIYIRSQLEQKLKTLSDDVENFISQSLCKFAIKKNELQEFQEFKGQKLLTFQKAHENLINSVTLLTPNLLCTGSYDGQIKIWDIAEKKAIIQLQNKLKIGKILIISEKIIAVASGDSILFWDWANQNLVSQFKAHNDEITDMALLDDNIMLTCSADFKIKQWDIQKGMCQRMYEGHQDRITEICVFDKTNFLTSSHDYLIKCWDIDKIDAQWQLVGHQGLVNSLMKITEQTLISCDSQGLILIWDFKSRKARSKIQMPDKQYQLNKLIKINDDIFATCSEDCTVKIFSLKDLMLLYDLKGHTGFVSNISTTFLENKIVSVGFDKKIIIWE